jgi:rubrerythrin
MTPVEALKLALSKEVETAELYLKFSAEYIVARDTFVFLAGEEQKHKALIEKRIAELTKY